MIHNLVTFPPADAARIAKAVGQVEGMRGEDGIQVRPTAKGLVVGLQSPNPGAGTLPAGFIRLRNATSAVSLVAGQTVGIGNAIDLAAPNWRMVRTFQAVALTEDHVARGAFAVLVDDLPYPQVVEARAYADAVLAKVDVTDLEHMAAGPAEGVFNLVSGDVGPVRIVWIATEETGVQWCLVRLGGAGSGIAAPTRDGDVWQVYEDPETNELSQGWGRARVMDTE